MAKSSLITITLIALCSWLGWTAFEEAWKPKPSIRARLADNGAATAGSQGKRTKKAGEESKKIVFPPLEDLGDIVARPLFNVSRRPIVAEKVKQDEKPADLNVMLSGIVIGQTEQIAHLRSATDKQTHALGVGDKIDGWKVESIFPDRVVLRSGGRVETLYMQKSGASNAVSGTPRTGAAGPATKRADPRALQRERRNLRRNRRRNGQ